ncbi:MAG: class I SAM-dependent methyltransferase [Akkermansiaceae bacterium]
MERVVCPEILDSLAGDDPRAVRSRRDLRLINVLMGNERWILKQEMKGALIELGAGEGQLTRKLSMNHKVTGLDFQERPEELEVAWLSGNLFETLPRVDGDTVVANLILHHFQDHDLKRLGGLIKKRRRLIAVEPWRHRIALWEGRLLWPVINEVTRHDMIVSIRAGFRKGDLPRLLDLGPEWEWREEVSLLGGIHVLAWRR